MAAMEKVTTAKVSATAKISAKAKSAAKVKPLVKSRKKNSKGSPKKGKKAAVESGQPQTDALKSIVLNVGGLPVLYEKIDYLRSVIVGVWVHVGSRNEVSAEQGFAHFVEHMLFKGTKRGSEKRSALVEKRNRTKIEMNKAKYYHFADIRKPNQGKGSSV